MSPAAIAPAEIQYPIPGDVPPRGPPRPTTPIFRGTI